MKLKYRITENECWECTSHCTNSEGYVKVTHNGKQSDGGFYAHSTFKTAIAKPMLYEVLFNIINNN